MTKTFYEFEFDEINFNKKVKELKNLICFCEKNDITANFIISPPSCIDIKNKICNKKKYVFNQKNYYITMNIISSKIVKPISKANVADKCIRCKKYNQKCCSGYFNKNFVKQIRQIKKNLGNDLYNALKYEYKDGSIAITSKCQKKCRHCFSQNIPNNLIRYVPELSPEIIQHFLEYIPYRINNNGHGGSTKHIIAGEFFSHPQAYKILLLIIRIFDNHQRIFTRDHINFIRTPSSIRQKIRWDISLDENLTKKVIDKIITIINEENLNYTFYILPKKNEDEIINKLDYLYNKGIKNIKINIPGHSKYNSIEKEELNLSLAEYTKMIIRIRKMFKLKDKHALTFSKLLPDVKKDMRQRLKQLKSIKNPMLVTGLNTEKILHVEMKYVGISGIIKGISSFGGTADIGGHMLIRDIKNQLDSKSQTLILPYEMFDTYFYDISLDNINNLTKKYKNVVIC